MFHLHQVTEFKQYDLRVVVAFTNGTKIHAEYEHLNIGSNITYYRLSWGRVNPSSGLGKEVVFRETHNHSIILSIDNCAC